MVAGGAARGPAAWLDYGPFGELSGGAPGTGPYRFAGYHDDWPAGRLDLGARLYDPRLRRFPQPDPLRAWRLYANSDVLARTLWGTTWAGTPGQVAAALGPSAWYAFTGYWLYAYWYRVWRRWRG